MSNEYMNSTARYVELLHVIGTNTQLSRFVASGDIQMIERRCEAEGITFLTMTLPKLGKCLDASFQTGVLNIPAELGFGQGGIYPRFMRAAWEVLFDEKGNLRWYEWSSDGLFASPATPCSEYADAALAIRQMTLMFYKLKLPYTAVQEGQCLNSFLATEDDLSRLDIAQYMDSPVLTRARQLVHRLLHRFNPMDIAPQHGSGASACGLDPWSRYGKPRFYPQIDSVYPYTEWYVSGLEQIGDQYPDLFEDADPPFPVAKVVFVPKDSRGPRLISEEPRETMFLQQGLMAKLYEAIEYYPNIRRQLSCIDQTRNRDLCTFASQTGAYSTLDMKEASDRVSCALVKFLFPDYWVRSLFATRSLATRLPDGTIVPLLKFAPMGSACCFPVEAICFWSISIAAMEIECGTLNHLFSLSPHRQPHVNVAVFGDDLIVPTRCYESVVEWLEKVGLKVNLHKSFTRGPFRESCGLDALSGIPVTPVRFNHPIETSKAKDKRTDRWHSMFRSVDAMNNLIQRYGCHLTPVFRELLLRWYGYKVPILALDDREKSRPSGLYLIGWESDIPRTRFNPDLFIRQMWVMRELPLLREVELTGWCQYLRGLIKSNPLRSLSVISPPRRYRYKWGWVAFR